MKLYQKKSIACISKY